MTNSLNYCLAVEEPSLLELRKTDLEKMGLKGKVKILKADFDSINFNAKKTSTSMEAQQTKHQYANRLNITRKGNGL